MSGVVGVVTEIVAPYRTTVFNELHALLESRLRVFSLAAMAGRPWAIERERIRCSYEIAKGAAWQPLGARSALYLNRPLAPRLARAGVGP